MNSSYLRDLHIIAIDEFARLKMIALYGSKRLKVSSMLYCYTYHYVIISRSYKADRQIKSDVFYAASRLGRFY